MNELNDFERVVAEQLARAGTPVPPSPVIDETVLRAGRERQLPRWLALIKEPPMRHASALAVGSPTARTAAIVVATLLLVAGLVGAGLAGARLLAADGPIIVAQDGSGHATTISEAVAMADDGSEIIVRPGTYPESVRIDKDVILKGESRDEVILEAPADGPTFDGMWYGPEQYGILLEDSAAEVSGLTIQGIGGEDAAVAIAVAGGSPFIHDITTDEGSWMSVTYHGAAGGTLRDSSLRVVFARDGSTPTIENNDILWHIGIENPVGTEPAQVRNNRLAGVTVAPYTPSGNWIGEAAGALVEGNHLRLPDGDPCCGPDFLGIHLVSSQGSIVRTNDLAGFSQGITVQSGASNVIEGNTLTDNDMAINVTSSNSRIEGNAIDGGRSGIVVAGLGAPELIDNRVSEVSARGIALSSGNPTLRGNVSCDNGEDLWIGTVATPDIDESNEICGGVTTP